MSFMKVPHANLHAKFRTRRPTSGGQREARGACPRALLNPQQEAPRERGAAPKRSEAGGLVLALCMTDAEASSRALLNLRVLHDLRHILAAAGVITEALG